MHAIATDHYKRFPCMKPRVGDHYRSAQHKRLLIIGESHYLPHESRIHDEATTWYSANEANLSSVEKDWVSTEAIISGSKLDGFTNKAHSIYRNISWELNELGLGYDVFQTSIEHCIYYNYFQRPARYGDSLRIDAADIEIAGSVLNLVIIEEAPELVVLTSALAGGYASSILEERGLDYCVTPHPGCPWWNRSAKKFGGLRGRDLFKNFLVDNRWIY